MTGKKYSKSFNGMIISAIIFFIISLCALGYSLLYPTAESLYKDGKIFGSTYKKDQELVAVKITSFDPKPIGEISGGRTNMYFIEFSGINTDNYGYAGIEIKNGDALVEKLKSESDLLNNPIIVAAKIRISGAEGAIKDYRNYFSLLVSQNGRIDERAEIYAYVSVDDFEKSHLAGYPIALIAASIGLYFLYSAFKLRKSEDNAYNELYDAYPELKYSMDTIFNKATYVDNQLGIVLYKNHLIVPLGSFKVYDLRKAERVYHYILNHKSYGKTVGRSSQLIILSNDKSYRKKKTSFVIKNVGEETDDLLQPFFYVLSQEFPDIQLGFEKSKKPLF